MRATADRRGNAAARHLRCALWQVLSENRKILRIEHSFKRGHLALGIERLRWSEPTEHLTKSIVERSGVYLEWHLFNRKCHSTRRVSRFLAAGQAEVRVLRCRLVSRRCHNISAMRRFVPGSSQNRTWSVTPSGSQPESLPPRGRNLHAILCKAYRLRSPSSHPDDQSSRAGPRARHAPCCESRESHGHGH